MNSLTPESLVGVGEKQFLTGLTIGVVIGIATKHYLAQEVDGVQRDSSLLPYGHDVAEVLEGQDYAIVGGLPIDAFNDEMSQIDAKARTITVLPEFDTKLWRDNGTVRDFDILMLPKNSAGEFEALSRESLKNTKAAIQAKVQSRAETNGDKAPAISVFSFDENTSLFHTSTMLDDDGKVTLRQGYTEKTLPDDAMKTWEIIFTDGLRMKVLSPWEQYWRSMVRFSSGMKSKDGEKLNKMLDKLRTTPGLAEMENKDMCKTYSEYYEQMLVNNSFGTFAGEIRSAERDWSRASNLGALTTARTILQAGEQVPLFRKIVQKAPVVFDHFVGGH